MGDKTSVEIGCSKCDGSMELGAMKGVCDEYGKLSLGMSRIREGFSRCQAAARAGSEISLGAGEWRRDRETNRGRVGGVTWEDLS